MSNIDLLKAITERRSIHTFKDEEVDLEILKDIFSYGTWAPNHYMKEPWNIKLYQGHGKNILIESTIASYQRLGMIKSNNDPKTLKMIQSMKKFLFQIPHHALIYFEKEQDPVRFEEEYSAVCAFIQNVQLAAWSYGVGMLWTITPYMHDPEFARDIGLDSHQDKIAAVLQIGIPQKIPRSKGRTGIDQKLEVISN